MTNFCSVVWVEGLTGMKEENGEKKMSCRYALQVPPSTPYLAIKKLVLGGFKSLN